MQTNNTDELEIDPRRWFIERIRSQAQKEGVVFTPFEQEYLFHTEQGDDETAVRMLDRIKGREFEDFDKRINGLAWRRYQADIASEANAKEEYKAQLRRLAEVDLPNLSMFISSIFLKLPPEELEPRFSWPLLLIAVLLLAGLIALRLSY